MTQQIDIRGQVALVTGATRGIGAAIALELARLGLRVVGTATTDDGAARIGTALAVLDERSRRVVEERWLKVNDDSSGGMTLHELAAEYGVSAERIRQIEVAALKKMRKALEVV